MGRSAMPLMERKVRFGGWQTGFSGFLRDEIGDRRLQFGDLAGDPRQ
jgi:hypothetical protein